MIMDYEEKYKEALERAKKLQETCDSTAVVGWCEYIFPELVESEDEKIRKLLIEAVIQVLQDQYCSNRGVSKEKVVAWLEKQGEQKADDKIEPKFHEGELIQPKDGGHEPWRILQVDMLDKKYRFKDGRVIHFSQEDAYKLVEQTVYDSKTEPKFKIGDWVVNKLGDSWHIDSCFDRKYYQISGGEGNYSYFPISEQDEMHLWTIQDAKDGDVLSTYAGAFIYNGNNGGGSCPGSYCGINTLGIFQNGTDTHWTGKTVHPATKEQRDTLFTKMNEAGYEWDAEKKELRKIKQDCIEIPFGAYDSELIEDTYFIPEGCYAVIVGDKVVIKKGER